MPVDLDKLINQAKRSGYIDACHEIAALAQEHVIVASVNGDLIEAKTILDMMGAVVRLSARKLREMKDGKETRD